MSSSPPGVPTVARVLEIARSRLGMDVAWLSAFTSTSQQFVAVADGGTGAGPQAGSTGSLEGSYCVRVLDGRLPGVVPRARQDPRTRDLAVTEELGIGAYAGSPVRAADGTVLGMLCCTSRVPRPDLDDSDRRVLDLLASVLAELHPEQVQDEQPVVDRVRRAVSGDGRTVVLQPIVDLRTGQAWGAEALSRFREEPVRPDLWFAEAERVGLRVELEVAACADALRHLAGPDAPAVLSVNLSSDAVVDGVLDGLLDGTDPARVVVEITEHAAVADYAALRQALRDLRARGLRLAVDDAGAGYASLRHVVQLSPDLIKIDMSLVRDIDSDPVKQALASSLVSFAQATGALLIAEGVETQAECDTVDGLGVGLVQGYLLARPGEPAPAP